MEAVTDFLFLDSKITEDGDCSHKIRKRLLLVRKAMKNLHSVLKGIDINLFTKGLYDQGYGLPSGHVYFLLLVHKEGRVSKN